MSKINVAIVFGGQSSEHQISLLSAKNVIEAIDRKRFEPFLIGIDKSGVWHFLGQELDLIHQEDAKRIALKKADHPILFSQNAKGHQIISQKDYKTIGTVDVLFPILHGVYGEDGSIQGLAKIANVPCVGCDILGSAIGMDKDITKRLLRDANIAVADFITLRKNYNDHIGYDFIADRLGSELFLKPANLGSSVGVSFVNQKETYDKAIRHAFTYDHKVIVEEKISGRELECAVLGNLNPSASVIGEVMPKSSWYSFENKYMDTDGAQLAIPALLDDQKKEEIRQLAKEVYRLLECQGMARIDFFMQDNGALIVNEINTIPGFTNISMYPKLWEASGIPYSHLITSLIELAIEQHQAYTKLIR